jgi:SAM-dependent methyltransferase
VLSFFKIFSSTGQSIVKDQGLLSALNEINSMDRYYMTLLLRTIESRYTIAGAIRLSEENKTALYVRSLISIAQRINILDKLYTIKDFDESLPNSPLAKEVGQLYNALIVKQGVDFIENKINQTVLELIHAGFNRIKAVIGLKNEVAKSLDVKRFRRLLVASFDDGFGAAAIVTNAPLLEEALVYDRFPSSLESSRVLIGRLAQSVADRIKFTEGPLDDYVNDFRGKFDAGILFMSFNWLSTNLFEFGQLHELVRPGGSLIVVQPLEENGFAYLYMLVQMLLGANKYPTLDELESMMSYAGFKKKSSRVEKGIGYIGEWLV